MNMKILTIIGARPQIIKAAAISRAIRNKFSTLIHEIIVHTGQHYDENMSSVFFDELNIPQPDYNLNVGSSNHGEQTARMLSGIEEIILKEKPQAVLVYGDTNSTVAGGLAASKLMVPLVHIEAGLRSFNKSMPEEINRILCDHVSTLLFTPTQQGIENLKREGFNIDYSGVYSIDNPGVFHCGDIMYDNSLYFSELVNSKNSLDEFKIEQPFILSTIHRNTNTDSPERLNAIFEALLAISANSAYQIVLPLHPRTKKMMELHLSEEINKKIIHTNQIKIIPPVSFLEVIALEKNAELIITDSGGVQKEAYFFQKPCIILRPETEWVEIVENGCALLCDADKDKIVQAFNYFKSKKELNYPPLFGDGNAAEFICKQLLNNLK